MNDAVLTLAIDGRPAQGGSAQFARSADDIKVKATQITAATEGVSRSFTRVRDAATTVHRQGISPLNAVLDEGRGKLQQYSGEIGGAGRVLGSFGTAGLAAAAAIGVMVLAIDKSLDAFREEELSLARLNAVLKMTNNASGETAQRISEMAGEIERSTLMTSEAVIDASSKLLTFQNVAGNTFERALKAAIGLAATGFGDAAGNAQKLGRALEDPINNLDTLTRMGIVFNESQKAQIKTLQESGEVLQAQSAYLDVVEQKANGVAEAMGSTLTGDIKHAADAFQDLGKAIGNAASQSGLLQSAAQNIEQWLDSLTDKLNFASGNLDRMSLDAIKKMATETEEAIQKRVALNAAGKEGADGEVVYSNWLGVTIKRTDELNPLLEKHKELLREISKRNMEAAGQAIAGLVAQQDAQARVNKAAAEAAALARAKLEADTAAELDKYIQTLENEYRLLQLSNRERAIQRNLIAAQNIEDKAKNQLDAESAEKIRQITGAIYDMQEAEKEAERQARALRKANEEMLRPLENGLDDITASLGDMAVEGEFSFEKLAEIGKRTAAEVAQAWIIKPIIMSAGAALFGGGGQAAGGGSPFAMMGNFAANAAGSAAGNMMGFNPLSMLNSFIGETAIGSAINAAGAAALPSLFSAGVTASSLGGAAAISATGGSGIGALSALGLNPATLALGAAAIAIPMIIDGFKPRAHPVSGFLAQTSDAGLTNLTMGSKHMDLETAKQTSSAVESLVKAIQSIQGVPSVKDQWVSGGYADGTSFLRLGPTPDAGKPDEKAIKFDPEKPESFTFALNDLALQMIAATDISENLATALNNIDIRGRSTEEVLADIAFAANFDKIDDAPEVLNAMEQAVKALNTQFDTAAATAKRLGLSEEEVEKARQKSIATLGKDFLSSIGDQILQITNPTALALNSIQKELDENLKSAKAAGVDTAKVYELYDAKITQVALSSTQTMLKAEQDLNEARVKDAQDAASFWKKTIEGLRDFRDSLVLDKTFSPLSPEQKYREAERQFSDVARRAAVGDAQATEKLEDVSKEFLQASLNYQDRNKAYAADFSRVQAAITNTESMATRHLNIANDQLTTLKEISTKLTNGLNPKQDFGKNPSLNMALAAVTNYRGDFTGKGDWQNYVRSDAVNEAQREAARKILISSGGIPGFAGGGVTGNIARIHNDELLYTGNSATVISAINTRKLLGANDNDLAAQMGRLQRVTTGQTRVLAGKMDVLARLLGELSDNLALAR